MSLQPLRQHIQSLKLPVETDENGHLIFTISDKRFVAFLDSEDAQYFRITLPRIYQVANLTEHFQMLETLNRLNAEYKLAKLAVIEGYVWVIIEFTLRDPSELPAHFERAIKTFEHVLNKFGPTLAEVKEKYNFDVTAQG